MVVPSYKTLGGKRFKLWNCYPAKSGAQTAAKLLKEGRIGAGGKRKVRIIKYYERGKGPVRYCVFQRRK